MTKIPGFLTKNYESNGAVHVLVCFEWVFTILVLEWVHNLCSCVVIGLVAALAPAGAGMCSELLKPGACCYWAW